MVALKSMNKSVGDISKQFDYSKDEGKYSFPHDDLPTKQKLGKEFAIRSAEAVWSEFCQHNSSYPTIEFGADVLTYDELREYSDGNQSVHKYKRILEPKLVRQADNNRNARNRRSWDIESPASRYKESVRAILKETDHTIQFRSVDPYNREQRARERFKLKEANSNKWLQDRMKALSVQIKATEFEPQGEEETDIYMNEVFEFAHERGMSLITSEIFKDSGLVGSDTGLRDDTHDDHFTLGIAAWKREIDWSGETPRIWFRYCDPKATIFPKSQYKDYRDAYYFAEVRFIDVASIRDEIQRTKGSVWTKEDEEGLKSAIKSVHGGEVLNAASSLGRVSKDDFIDHQRDSHGKFAYDYLKLPVLDGVIRSYDTDVYVTKKNESGAKFVEKKNPGYKPTGEGKEVKAVGRNCWYQYKWLIGTNITLSYGKMPWNVNESPFIIQRVTNRPIVSQMIPMIDKLQIIKFQSDNAWYKVAPKGMRINWKELQGMMFAGKTITPWQVLELRRAHGDLLTNGNQDTPHRRASGPQTGELEGGVGRILDESIKAVGFEYEKLNRVTGINEAMLGESPKTNQLVGTTEIAVSGSRSRIRYLYDGYFAMKGRAATLTAKTIQAIVLHYPEAFPELNDGVRNAIKLGAEIYNYRYDIRARIVPNDQMRASMYQDLSDAVARQAIGLDDRLELMELVESGEFDFARRLLRIRIREKQKMASAAAQEQLKGEAQKEAQGSQNRINENTARIKDEGEKESSLEQLKAQLEASLIAVQGAIDSKHIAEQAREKQTAEK